MRSSYVVAAALAVGATLWVLSGQLGGGAVVRPASPIIAAEAPLPRVRVKDSVAESLATEVVVQGRTHASRQVTLRAETAGRVIALPKAEGEPVREGDVIARLAMDDREARLAEVRAVLAQREIEYRAASQLSDRGFASQTKLAEALSRLDQARAELARVTLDIARTTIRAPFAGALQRREVEIGSLLAPGGEVALVMDLAPALVVAEVSERDIAAIRPGSRARALLVTGAERTGTVTYVSVAARPATRTFAVEVTLDDDGHPVPEGLTAELRLPARQVSAHRIPPSALTLDDAGRIGVKTVDAAGVVAFREAAIVGDEPGLLWLAGLPAQARVITLGQDYVRPGQKVVGVAQDAAAAR